MDKMTIAFDQYQRYKTIQLIVERAKQNLGAPSLRILEIGANEHKNLGRFLPEDDICYSDISLSGELLNDPQYIFADAMDMAGIEDAAFDLVVALDVFEHIPADKRERFISEICRVGKYGAVLCFPFDAPHILDAEARANEYFRAIAGYDHIFLREHIKHGLPNIDATEACLRQKDYKFYKFEHSDIFLWEMLIKAHLYTSFIPEAAAYLSKVDRYYNSFVYTKDRSAANYRVFFTISRDEAIIEAAKAAETEFVEESADRDIRFFERCIDDMDKIAALRTRIKYEACKNDLERYKARQQDYEEKKAAYKKYKAAYEEILVSTCWRVTKPIRILGDSLKKLKAALQNMRNGGSKTSKRQSLGYDKAQTFELSRHTRQEQERKRFTKDIQFSILTPLYNTPKAFLKAMLDSVVGQTYANWELCLADGSGAGYEYVGKICKKYAKRDKRLKYKKLEKNEGIGGNTNRCIEMAGGDYIALLDHDDVLHPAALFEVMSAICDQGADMVYTDEGIFSKRPQDAYIVHYKPDYSPDTLRAHNYICHLNVFSCGLLEQAGRYSIEYDGSQDYDMTLRITEKAVNIVHIPKILYFWRAHKDSVAAGLEAKPYAFNAAKRALADHLNRIGLDGRVEDARFLSTYRINYAIHNAPMVSIIIPNKDQASVLKNCVDSILTKSTYTNYEIIIVENNSVEAATFDYYNTLKNPARVRVIQFYGEFNYSTVNNLGAKRAKGDILLLLNNDTEVITPNWIEEMLMFAQREDVGAVGAMLYYPDDTIQHGGVILGIGDVAGHSHRHFKRNTGGYMSRPYIVQNLSAVTGACVMIPKRVYDKINGLDEGYAVAFGDVDLCMRIREEGYLIVFTPYAELYHHESISRGPDDTPENSTRSKLETKHFHSKWFEVLEKGDPYYNPNLTLATEDFAYKK